MENFRNIIDVSLVSNENNYLKWTSKQGHMSHKIFDKVSLTINKLAYAGICIFHWYKLLMHKLHCDCSKNKSGQNSRLLFIGTDV